MAISFASAAGKVASCFEKGDVQGMRHLHDELLMAVSLKYEEGLYELGLLTYILSKVQSKPRFWKKARQSTYWLETRRQLHEVEYASRRGDMGDSLARLQNIFKRIETAEGQDPRFVRSLATKARVKAASTFYAQGLSLGRAAEITGLDKREILSYAGGTTMNERLPPTIAVSERVRKLRALFR